MKSKYRYQREMGELALHGYFYNADGVKCKPDGTTNVRPSSENIGKFSEVVHTQVFESRNDDIQGSQDAYD